MAMNRKPGPERETRREIRKQEQDDSDQDLRGNGEWLEGIGPEDMSRERVIDNLENYGFDLMGTDDTLDLPETAGVGGYNVENKGQPMEPFEVGEELAETPYGGESFRPTEDDALDELDLDGDGEVTRDEIT